MTNTNTVAATMSVFNLIHVARTLNAELEASIKTGERGTQAHVGRLEMITACTDELVKRGYLHGNLADGSDMPQETDIETGPDGVRIRLSFSIRVF